MLAKAIASWFIGYASQFIIGPGLALLATLVAIVAAPDHPSFNFPELLTAVFGFELSVRILAAIMIAFVVCLAGTYKRAIFWAVFLNQLIVAYIIIGTGLNF